MYFKSSSRRSKKNLPLASEAWNIIIDNFIAFIHSVEVPRGLAREDGDEVEFLHLFVNYIMESPFVTTWTIPKFNRIMLISFEEFSEFPKDCRQLNLIWLDQ